MNRLPTRPSFEGGHVDESPRYYRLSGEMGPVGPVMAFAYGVLAAVLLAIPYGYAIRYIPIVYLNVLITLVFGGFIGWMTGKGGMAGKIRNATILGVVGIVTGATALYCGWVGWLFALSGGKSLVLWPPDLWGFVGEIAKVGTWSLRGGQNVSGWTLYIVWIFEAVFIVGLSWFIAANHLEDEVFCERCQVWLGEPRNSGSLEVPPDPDAFRAAVEGGDINPLLALFRSSGTPELFALVNWWHCARCRQISVVKVSAIRTTLNDKKNEETETAVLLDPMQIGAADVARLEEAAATPRAPAVENDPTDESKEGPAQG